MCGATVTACICWVALRKESVDRNRTPHHRNTRPIPSLSARRAWIEILTDDISTGGKIKVALRKESVDRNYGDDLMFADGAGRSPQGERG